ncbi:MAG: type II toxin-antitoxin system VapC family toxin [Candidatus Woesearchaeota archaeon]
MIADTTFLIDFLNGKKEILPILKNINSPIKTTTINEYELLVGVTKVEGIDVEKRIEHIKNFLDMFEILQLDRKSISKSARICGDLIQKGKKIDDNDCFIAGIALRNGIDTIITKNKSHFERIPGIKIIGH